MDKKKAKELIMYVIFGVITTVVSWGAYTIFINACKMPVFWANVLSWICAISFAYVTNKLWVFESKSWSGKIIIKEIITFVASRGVTGVIEIVAVPILVKLSFDSIFYNMLEKMNISAKILFTDGIYSKITISFIIVILNYVFSKLIVFKNRKD